MCLSFFHHIHSLFCKTAVYQYDSPMQTKAIFLLFILFGVAGCGTAVAPALSPADVVPTPTHHAAVVVTVRITPTPSATPLVAATAATAVTAAATAPPPTATPHPMAPYTIAGLRQRDYPGGVIEITSWMADAEFFDKYAIT
ncbi:MAG: hypothetical protein IPJ90_22300 [Anaerolineaceae bacterium]|nr:hypothetical protein [Anaerolineaceae bacterium]